MWNDITYWLGRNLVDIGIVSVQVAVAVFVLGVIYLIWRLRTDKVCVPNVVIKALPKAFLVYEPMFLGVASGLAAVDVPTCKFLLRAELERDEVYDGRVGGWLLFGVKAKHNVGGKKSQVWDCTAELAVKDRLDSAGNKLLSQCRIIEGSLLKLALGGWQIVVRGPLEKGIMVFGVVSNVYVEEMEVVQRVGKPELNVWVCKVRQYRIIQGST